MRLRNLLGPLPSVSGSIIVSLIFLTFFAAVCLYVFRRERRGVYDHLQRLPLEEEEKEV